MGFDQQVLAFIEADKEIRQRVRWATKNRADHAELSAHVLAKDGPRWMSGKLKVVAHRTMLPAKYGFSLLFRGERVLALDVNPNRSHRNLLTGRSVAVTHWQRYPGMEAEMDDRPLSFSLWADEFMQAANISLAYRLATPPYGQQLDLELKPWKR